MAVMPADGCSLAQYAHAKRLSVALLESFGLTDQRRDGRTAIRIPYHDPKGREQSVRYRLALFGHDRFRWMKGASPTLYGLDRLEAIRHQGYAILVEGESDCHTGWFHDEPVLGVPGAGTWKEDWAMRFDGIDPIYLVVESDQGGRTLQGKLLASPLRSRLRLIHLANAKDLSDLHCQDPTRFSERLAQARKAALSAESVAAAETQAARDEVWRDCRDLALSTRILDRLTESLRAKGVAGETRLAHLLFLAVISRLLPRVVSAVVKGPSSAGKSYVTQAVLDHFTPDAYYARTAMSARTLIYTEESLAHRMLVVYEAAAIDDEFQNYVIRSLLSEGQIIYETVEKVAGQFTTRLIEKPGPTGVVLTTTAITLHPENETRMLSVPVDDSPEQTRRVLRATAAAESAPAESLEPWHALDRWIALGMHRVVIPYSAELAERIPTVAIRLRRDFPTVLRLIQAHALLHQATRDRDAEGRIVATLEDYAVVRELVGDLLADAAAVTVSDTVRDSVDAVRRLTLKEPEGVSQVQVARHLTLDASCVSRRIKVALARGYVVNNQSRPGQPAQLVLGDPLPDETMVLPSPEVLQSCMPVHEPVQQLQPMDSGDHEASCSHAAIPEGTTTDGGDDATPDWVTQDELDGEESFRI